MKYKIITYGCQMNIHDSEVISGVLEEKGYRPAKTLKESDVIVLNTCCIRENAERKVYGRISQLKLLKNKKHNLLIAITGCMIKQSHVVKHILKNHPYVDLIFGIQNVHKLPKLIEKSNEVDFTLVDIEGENTCIKEGMPIIRDDPKKAWVTINYGCNNFCSYCVVPYVRGREKSRNPENILQEVEQLADNGYIEINLLGQNVNSYGKDLEQPTTFPDLLRKINTVDKIQRIRFITSHPKDLSNDLIEAIRDCEKVCNHIHLPVQAGSNKILKQMNRNYTKEDYMQIVKKLRLAVPDIAITTDIIVGFPGETEQDFQETIDLIKQVEFDSAFTFIYSKRSGTRAAQMENQIDEEIKKDRLLRLMDIQDKISLKKNIKLRGKILEVLVEGRSKNNPKRLSGRSQTNKLVNFEGSKDLIGKLVNVKITTPRTWSLIGTIKG
mgnify:CR=1 FL=1